jgi:hypothetical protein
MISVPSEMLLVRDFANVQSAPERLLIELFDLVPSKARLANLLVGGYTITAGRSGTPGAEQRRPAGCVAVVEAPSD